MAESEFTLLRRFSVYGDAEAFAQIINLHTPMVYGACLRILDNKEKAADVVQDTFFRLVHDASLITESLPNWLHRVATCRAIDLMRSESQRKQRELKYATNFKNIESEDNKAIWREISFFIDEEIEKLDVLTREVIILHFFEGETMTDIADKFGISQATVSRRIESGIDSLRDKLKSRGVIVTSAILGTLLTENIVQAAPASIMRELGKIAIAGSKAITAAEIASTVSTIAAVKMKLIVGMMIVLAGAGITVVFSFFANGENKSASIWELVTQPQEKQTQESQPQENQTPEKQPEPDNKINEVKTVNNNADITANQLLAKYTQALNSSKSFISKTETSSTFINDLGEDAPSSALKGYYKKGGRFEKSEIRYDGERVHYRKYSWLEPNPPKESRIRDKASDFRLINFADCINYRHSMTINTEGFGGMVMVNPFEGPSLPDSENIMVGLYLFDPYTRVDKVLEKATKLSVRPATEKIGDFECYVLDAETINGKISVWIDPDHGYQHAKVEILMTESDAMGSTGQDKLTKGQTNSRIINYGRFEQVDGTWVPMEYDTTNKLIFGPDGYVDGETHFKRTEIVLNPDHDALGSFDSPLRNPENDPELVNGNPVQITYLNTRFTWQDGKLLDENGEVFDIDNIKPVSLLGKALPGFNEVRLNREAIKNKKLLMCFWDMDNAESKNYIRTLNKRAEALLDTKDLYMVFMHAGVLEDKTFQSWLKKNEILPPAGYMELSKDGFGYRWGVKSLPWLILTDTNHIVIAEGFSISELDEKLIND